MLQGWIVIACALGYIGLLFVIASYGDQTRRFGREGRWRHFIYPLSLAIYCTSWTFFGSVGLASRTGFDFLTIYIGPMLVIGLCSPLIVRSPTGGLHIYYKHDGRQRVVKLKQRFTKDEAAKTEHRGPDDAASGIGRQKCAPRHAIQSGEECRQYTQ